MQQCLIQGLKGQKPIVPSAGIGKCLTAWEDELGDHKDRNVILACITHGFDIIDPTANHTRIEAYNHPSASPKGSLIEKATEQIESEIANGHYVLVDKPPVIVSPIAAIPKSDGGFGWYMIVAGQRALL